MYFPTIESCKQAGFKRFPAKYDSGSMDGKNRKAAESIGAQYEKFGSTNQAKSLQKLDVVNGFNPRDIVLEVLTNQPYTIKTKTENGVTKSEYNYGGATPEPKYKIHISPTQPVNGDFELSVNHQHTWEAAGSIFDKILKGAAELIGNVDDFVTKLGNVSKGVQGQNNKDAYKATPNRRVDVAETYVSTEKQSIVIPFTLFTLGGEKNFLRDIYDPITLLTEVSYPKRSTATGGIDKWLGQKMGVKSSGSEGSGATGTDTEGQPQSDKEDPGALDAINAINPGFRVFISDPPAYINVYHNGGLFKYNNCYITKFSYKYKLWVDGDGEPLNTLSSDSKITDASLKNARFAYPTVAECEIELKTTEPLFADDFNILAQQFSKNRSTQSRGG